MSAAAFRPEHVRLFEGPDQESFAGRWAAQLRDKGYHVRTLKRDVRAFGSAVRVTVVGFAESGERLIGQIAKRERPTPGVWLFYNLKAMQLWREGRNVRLLAVKPDETPEPWVA